MSSLPGPIPEPFCEKPRQVPPFPVKRCVSNPSPHPHVRHSLPIIRSQSTGNRLQQYLSYDGESLGSRYAPRYRPVRIEPSAQPLSISEESQDSEVSRDLASRPTSFYSQFSQPSSEVLPNEEALTHIPFPDWPRIDAYNRPFSLDSIPSLPKSRPTSLPAPHFNPAIYDQIIDSEMSSSLISDIESLVEPLSFYQVRMTGSFSQIVQAMMEAKSAWSTRSSLDGDEGESCYGDDDDESEDDSDVSQCSFDSKGQEAMLVSELHHGSFV